MTINLSRPAGPFLFTAGIALVIAALCPLWAVGAWLAFVGVLWMSDAD